MATSRIFGMTGVVLFVSTAVLGEYTGLSHEVIPTVGVPGTRTIRVYATFSDGDDQLTAVYGDADNPLLIDSTNGFFQHIFGGPVSLHINPALWITGLEYDSWVTIGLEDTIDNAMAYVGIDWTSFEAGGALETSNGAWFATPDETQTIAGAEMRVMIAQLTPFTGPDLDPAVIFGHVSMQGRTADGTTWVELNEAFSYTIPAPGAIVAFGVPFFILRRRRSA